MSRPESLREELVQASHRDAPATVRAQMAEACRIFRDEYASSCTLAIVEPRVRQPAREVGMGELEPAHRTARMRAVAVPEEFARSGRAEGRSE